MFDVDNMQMHVLNYRRWTLESLSHTGLIMALRVSPTAMPGGYRSSYNVSSSYRLFCWPASCPTLRDGWLVMAGSSRLRKCISVFNMVECRPKRLRAHSIKWKCSLLPRTKYRWKDSRQYSEMIISIVDVVCWLLAQSNFSNNLEASMALYVWFSTGKILMLTVIDYAGTIFSQSLGFDSHFAALMSGFLFTWFFIASFIPWFLIDRIGRRPLVYQFFSRSSSPTDNFIASLFDSANGSCICSHGRASLANPISDIYSTYVQCFS